MEKSKIQSIVFMALLLAGIMIWVYPRLRGKGDVSRLRLDKYKVISIAEPNYREDFFENQKRKEAKRPKLIWDRDPFQLPTKRGAGTELVLTGIAVDEKGEIAIINNEIVREGDVVSDAKIVEIKKDSVTVEREGKTFDLKIFEEIR